MRNIPNATNSIGQAGGNHEFLIQQVGKLLKGDSAGSLKKLQDALQQLTAEKNVLVHELVSAYQERRSEGVSQGRALSELEGKLRVALEGPEHSGEGEDLDKLVGAMQGGGSGAAALATYIAQAIAETEADNPDGYWKNLDMARADIEQLVMIILMAASKAAHDELKAMLEELKKQNQQKARARRTAAIGASAGFLLLVGVIFGPRLAPPPPTDSEPPEQNANLPAVQQPAVDAGPPIGPTPRCTIAITSPTGAVSLPASGPVNLQWSSDPHGISYTLEVLPPEGKPWVVGTDNSSKNIFMENFPAGGTYEFAVSTLDAYGAMMCRTVVRFEKPASDEAQAKKEEGDGAYCDPYGNFGC